ncbi:hypothetical protein [Rhodococcus sp. W8901]|uniref:hypothetical protein n=1 Tax=Rhodococcus sp. W8901 TaxID=2742603 RepID=UPI001581E881|nr:hypothetical protein [Rhodococcus sp. W8901]QKT10581.1 hypothetical protein HUN07_07485 [Rhodococcus sp. W8901]
MTKSLIRNVTRRKVAVAAASIAAAGALAVPGVAWAQNSLPSGEPVAVTSPTDSAPAAVMTEACSTENLSEEEIQKLIADGAENGPVVTEAGASTESTAAAELSEAAYVEADAAPAVTSSTDSADTVMITARAC